MKKIIAFILCALCLLFCACSLNEISSQDNNSSTNTIENSSNSALNSNSGAGEEGGCDIYNTIYNTYQLTPESSMVLVELMNITEGFFSNYFEQDHIIVEFKVINDYYNNIESNTIIYIPIYLNKIISPISQDFAVYDDIDSIGNIEYNRISDSELSIFLEQYQKAIIFIEKVNENQTWFKKGNFKDRVQFDNITDRIILYNHYFPIGKDNVVQFDEVLNFLNDNNCFYDSPYSNIDFFSNFVYKDISLVEFEKNIQNLYQFQQNK